MLRLLKDICQEIFSEAEIRIGSEPNLTVAKGLALVGRTDFKIKAFRRDVDAFIASEELSITLKDELPKLTDVIANQLFEQILSIRNKNFHKWIEGEFDTIDKIEDKIQSEIYDLANNWFESINLVDWAKKLSDRIESMTHDICDKYRIPRTTFNLFSQPTKYDTLDLKSLLDEINISRLIFKSIMSMAISRTLQILPMITSLPATILAAIFIPRVRLALKRYFSVPSRKSLFSDRDINREMEENRAEITEQIAEELKKQLNFTNLLDNFSNSIKEALNKKADEASVIIK